MKKELSHFRKSRCPAEPFKS